MKMKYKNLDINLAKLEQQQTTTPLEKMTVICILYYIVAYIQHNSDVSLANRLTSVSEAVLWTRN